MLISSDGHTLVHMSPARVLESLDGYISRIRERPGRVGPNKETRTALERLEAQRHAASRPAEEETIAQWGTHQRLLKVHRGLADEHAHAIREMTPEYVAAVRREQKRWDAEQAHALAAEFSTNGEAVMTDT